MVDALHLFYKQGVKIEKDLPNLKQIELSKASKFYREDVEDAAQIIQSNNPLIAPAQPHNNPYSSLLVTTPHPKLLTNNDMKLIPVMVTPQPTVVIATKANIPENKLNAVRKATIQQMETPKPKEVAQVSNSINPTQKAIPQKPVKISSDNNQQMPINSKSKKSAKKHKRKSKPKVIAQNASNENGSISTIEQNMSNTTATSSEKEVKDDYLISPAIYFTLLGERQDKYIDPKINLDPLPMSGSIIEKIPNLPPINKSQSEAIIYALHHPITLIQGPPGTGKTITSTYIVYHLVKRYPKQVLVCSASNAAIDNIAYWIGQTGIKVIRVCASSRENIDSKAKQYSLHELIKGMKGYKVMHKLMQRKANNAKLDDSEMAKLKSEKMKAAAQMLKSAEVVCTTCMNVTDKRLVNYKFTRILIDEATQAKEPESLIPLMKGAIQLILVGDHKQLKPCVKCLDCAEHGLEKSMFERLNGFKVKSFLLTDQYRMHPAIAQISSQLFYSSNLKDGVQIADRLDKNTQDIWPDSKTPILFVNTNGKEELSSTGKSYINQTEILCLLDFLEFFLQKNNNDKSVGIITPYKGQKAIICNYINHSYLYSKSKEIFQKVEISSVDSFQGRELDYIILSLVRSDEYTGIGFLKEECRLNVSITRGKYGLIIIGNEYVLRNYNIWSKLLDILKYKHTTIVFLSHRECRHYTNSCTKQLNLSNSTRHTTM